MKVLHATKRYPNSAGGDATVVKSLERVQRESGHETIILTSNCPDIVDEPYVRKFGLEIASPDIDTINLKRIISLAWLFLVSFREVGRARPDVIHSHSMDLGFFLRPAAWLYRIPIINHCHGTSIGKADFPKYKKALELFFLKYGRFQRIITVDEPSLQSFKYHGLKRVVYIPNGVEKADAAKVTKKASDKKTRIIFVGRLEWVKGVPELLKAFSMLKDGTDLELGLVGDGSETESLKVKAEKLGIADRTTFYGRQKREETHRLMAGADIFVLPSHFEGFPIVMLEAWAIGLPVVVSRVGAMQTVCHDGKDSLLIEPKRPEELAATLKRLIDDKALQAKLGAAGRKLIEARYNYNTVNKRVQAIYDEVVK
jgi:glycosyltransferase involved in cell wall biosynthesis